MALKYWVTWLKMLVNLWLIIEYIIIKKLKNIF